MQFPLLKRIKAILNALKVESTKPVFDSDKRIVEAFKIEGVQYYTFDDMFSLPHERAFAAVDYYSELKSGVSRDYLEGYLKTQKALKIGNRIDIGQSALLDKHLEERMERIFPHELVYKLASVVYFDKTENPYTFEYKYAFEKIKQFKKASYEDFFLKTPVRQFLPFKDISKSDLDTYIQVGNQVNQQHLLALASFMKSRKESSEGLLREQELLNILV